MCYMILIHDIYGEVCLLVLARNGVLGVHDDLMCKRHFRHFELQMQAADWTCTRTGVSATVYV